MRLFLVLWGCIISLWSHSQSVYSATYGKEGNPPLLYLHGGPRGNATLFEGTTAQALADKGFYVVVYDRRGEGRSVDTSATFTFQEAFNDINILLQHYQLQQVSIIGHSFGGIIATLYTNAFPEKVKNLILVGALFSQQDTYNHILRSIGKKYTQLKDTSGLKRINAIKMLDKNTAVYRQQCYEIAGEHGYFKMPFPTEAAQALRLAYEKSSFNTNNIRNDRAPVLFYQNEQLVNINTSSTIRRIKRKGVPVYAIYGAQDNIFSTQQLFNMRKMTGKKQFSLLENCSHYPFVDQQEAFIGCLQTWLQPLYHY